jgi:hypothetical protein
VVLFVNLDQVESRGIRAITSLALDRPVGSVSMVDSPGADKAIVVHSGSTALSVIDLSQRFDMTLPGSATLQNTAFSAGGDYLFTTVAERAVLAIIELANGHPSQVDIPEPGGQLAVMRNPQVILVDHGAPEGRFTLLDGVSPSEATAVTVEGLFLKDVFGHADALETEGEED